MISHRGISVITPLPSGEGKGEGPPLAGILIIQIEGVKIFYTLFPSTFEKRLSMQQEHALLRSRTCFSCVKKGVFYEQEGHILERKT
ncbi:hypothetical protein AXF23_01770 [Prevotella sp. oral taxon 313]|nr:hypothetical protein AXF23_01770 [Prevotella sp. oral taxon 313]